MSPWVTLALGLVSPVGLGLAWLFGLFERRASTREAKLENWHRELVDRERNLEQGRTAYTRSLEERFEAMERREQAREATDLARDEQMRALRIAFDLVSSALRVRDPTNVALRHAEQILATAFPVEIGLPSDMIGHLRELETVPSTGGQTR